jgi:hypothetical protein
MLLLASPAVALTPKMPVHSKISTSKAIVTKKPVAHANARHRYRITKKVAMRGRGHREIDALNRARIERLSSVYRSACPGDRFRGHGPEERQIR